MVTHVKRSGQPTKAVRIGRAGCCALAILIGGSPATGAELKKGPSYSGMCDASAAVAIDAETFIVANDEDNTLRVFRRNSAGREPAAPIAEADLSGFLKPQGKPETDIEGAARLGDQVYWITSHGRNKSAKLRPSRYRFFATKVTRNGRQITIEPTGKPYMRLLDDLLADERLAKYKLKAASKKAPKAKDALNIEGLCAVPNRGLIFAFRNPIRKGKALLVPLKNAADVVAGAARAEFGKPIELDLAGLGVRSIEYDELNRRFIIVAGPYKSGVGDFRLYHWSGDPAQVPKHVKLDFAKLNPEALFIYPGGGKNRIHILSDDGTRKIDGKDCKTLAVPSLRRFRTAVLRD